MSKTIVAALVVGLVLGGGTIWFWKSQTDRVATSHYKATADSLEKQLDEIRSGKRVGFSLTGVRDHELKVGDASLAQIAALPKLQVLSLRATRVTDDGIGELAAATSLEELYLDNTAVGDNAMETLAALPNLYELSLLETQVTAEGLKTLAAAPSLEYLVVSHELGDAAKEAFKDTDVKIDAMGIDEEA